MYRFARAGVIGLIAGAFLLAGCSASGAPTAPGTTSGPATAGSSVGPGDSTAGQGGTTASCKQLTAAEAQPLVVDQITTVTITPYGLHGTGQECRFNTTDDSVSVDVTVDGGADGTAEYEGTTFANPAPLPGVGDKAIWDSNNESSLFAAIKGTVYCSVDVDAENVPGVAHLMDEVNNTIRIGDANYQILAATAATLCNRIYGSGDTTIDLSGLSTPPSIAP